MGWPCTRLSPNLTLNPHICQKFAHAIATSCFFKKNLEHKFACLKFECIIIIVMRSYSVQSRSAQNLLMVDPNLV